EKVEPRLELRTSLAQIALVTLRLDEAEESLRVILDSQSATPSQRLRATATYAFVLTYRGQGDAARELLGKLEAETNDPIEIGFLATYAALTLWYEERDAEAAERLPKARVLLGGELPSYRAALPPAIFAMVLARLGEWDEAQRLFETADAVLQE